MKARLLVGRNGRSAGEVIEYVQPGTGPGLIPLEAAEWFNDDEDVKPISPKSAERRAAAVEEKKK
jgi:hypothetical protein